MVGLIAGGDGKFIYFPAYVRPVPSVVSKLYRRVMPMIRTAPTARGDFPVAERRNHRGSHLKWLVRRERFLCALGALMQ